MGSDEDFAQEVILAMQGDDVENEYYVLGCDIYLELAKQAIKNLGIEVGDDPEKVVDVIEEMDKLYRDDGTLIKAIKKFKKEYDGTKVNAVMKAFHTSYENLSFDDLTEEIRSLIERGY